MISELVGEGQFQRDEGSWPPLFTVMLLGLGIVYIVSLVTLFRQNWAEKVPLLSSDGLVPVLLTVAPLVGVVLLVLGADFLITAAVALGCGLLTGLILLKPG